MREHARPTLRRSSRRPRPFKLAAVAALACALALGGTVPLVAPRVADGDRADAPGESAASTASSPDGQPALPLCEQDGLARDDWRLALVNAEHPLDPSYEPPLATSSDGRLVDKRCLPDYERMLDDCRAAGFDPFVASAYRTRDYQEGLYEEQVRSLRAEGLPEQEARTQATTAVAAPGTSEHELGLAFDIVDEHDPGLVEEQASTPTQRWLLEHCWEYGFVLRYPQDKRDVTRVMFEPWHYRYVGAEAARTMREQGLCLEEYLAG